MAPQVVENEGDISALKGTDVDLRNPPQQAGPIGPSAFSTIKSTLDLSQSGVSGFFGKLARSEGRDRTWFKSPATAANIIRALPNTRWKRSMMARPKVVISETDAGCSCDQCGRGLFGNQGGRRYWSEEGGTALFGQWRSGKDGSLYSVENLLKQSVTGAHTFFLEEFGLQPGDIISYYAKAWDNNNVTGPGKRQLGYLFHRGASF